MPNIRTKPWMIAFRTKKSQTQDVHVHVHVHVGSCDDNTLTLCNGGWSTTQHLVLMVKGRGNLILH